MQRHHFANKGRSRQSYGFTSVMYGCENWTIKKTECQRVEAFELVLKKALDSTMDCKKIKPVNPKGNKS